MTSKITAQQLKDVYADKSTGTAQSFTGNVSAPALIATGLTGSVAASRYVGATASGAPASGAHLLGDWAIDQTGTIWVCTVAGTPGTWVAPGGGSLPSWFQYGNGSPVGAVTPDQINAIYVDVDATTPGGFYKAGGATSADWTSMGGEADYTVPGLRVNANGFVFLIGASPGTSVVLTDVAGIAGTENGLFFLSGAGDGAQTVSLQLGSTGQYQWFFAADGTTTFPGDVDTHDHNIAVGNGQITADSGAGPAAVFDQSGVAAQDGLGATAELTYSGGVTSNPTSAAAFTAGSAGGSTVALDGGGLLIENAVWDGGGP